MGSPEKRTAANDGSGPELDNRDLLPSVQPVALDGHRHVVGVEPPEFDGHVVLDDALLGLDRTLHRVDSACELDQAPSPVSLTIRPRCSAILGSINV